jgi:hypothetical protein
MLNCSSQEMCAKSKLIWDNDAATIAWRVEDIGSNISSQIPKQIILSSHCALDELTDPSDTAQ